MAAGDKYWTVLGPRWTAISIDSPEAFENTFNQVPRPIGLLYAAYFCRYEVCNGGFTHFFWNSTGALGPEAIEGFKAIGQQRVGGVVQRAISQLDISYSRTEVIDGAHWNGWSR